MRVQSGHRPTLGLGGDGDVVEVVGHAARGNTATAGATRWRGCGVGPFVYACEAATCCWAVVSRRGAGVSRRRAPRVICPTREQRVVF